MELEVHGYDWTWQEVMYDDKQLGTKVKNGKRAGITKPYFRGLQPFALLPSSGYHPNPAQ